MAEKAGALGEHALRVAEALSRPLAALQGDSRQGRLDALAGLREALLERALPPAVVQEVFGKLALRPLLRCLASDPAERCRELALELTAQGLSRGNQPAQALPFLMPVLARRLGPAPGEEGEPCEELRLGLLQLFGQTLQACDGGGAALAPYLPELGRVLAGALLDPYPKAKLEGCAALAACAKAMPEHFHLQSESLINPLMKTISHQHYRVRVAVVQATGAVIQFGNVKSLDDVLPHLAQRCFDDIPQVREAVISVIGEWLLHLRDRYSYFHKLIPLLLSGLTDEMHENKELALTYWKKVGSQWEKENEDDIKDKCDFCCEPSFYPQGLTRPELGCRELVTRNLSKILPGLCHDMTDWVEGTKVKASQLLVILLQHAEDHTTQHMELLLRTLYRVCSDEHRIIVRNCLEAAKLIGVFVSPAVSLKLIVSDLERAPMPSYLMVLAAVIRGSPRKILQPHLVYLSNMLSQPEISQRSEEVFYVTQLLCCVEALIEVCQDDCKEVSLQLTKVLVTIMAIPPNVGHLHEKIEDAMISLAKVQHLEGIVGLYRQHMAQLMEWVSLTHDSWTCYSPELLQLDVIATHSGPVIGEALKDFICILKTCLQTSRDARMRLKLFSTLSQLLLKPNETLNSEGRFCNYLEILIKDILAPNLQWQAGKIAAAIRTTAVSCLWALISSEFLSPEEMQRVGEELLPKILTTLEDDSKMTRLMSCRIMGTLLDCCGKQFDLVKICPELLNRLEDASREVRLAAANALTCWFKCISEKEEKVLLKDNIETTYRILLSHLDDPDQNIQSATLDVLKEGGVLYPDILAKEIKAVVYKHRTPTYCDQLLLHMESTGWRDSGS
uniref:Dynein axonemal assembly factor 5 n=1 Tax=Pogona vitticeps TaxID=103695 RepID=A0ABM5F123_9SAUR